MKLLTATDKTQGARENDEFAGVPGELLVIPFDVHPGHTNPDGECACARTLVGVASGGTTTTFEVVDVEISDEDWILTVFRAVPDELIPHAYERMQVAAQIARDLRYVTKYLEPGTIVERRGKAGFMPREA